VVTSRTERGATDALSTTTRPYSFKRLSVCAFFSPSAPPFVLSRILFPTKAAFPSASLIFASVRSESVTDAHTAVHSWYKLAIPPNSRSPIRHRSWVSGDLRFSLMVVALILGCGRARIDESLVMRTRAAHNFGSMTHDRVAGPVPTRISWRELRSSLNQNSSLFRPRAVGAMKRSARLQGVRCDGGDLIR